MKNQGEIKKKKNLATSVLDSIRCISEIILIFSKQTPKISMVSSSSGSKNKHLLILFYCFFSK